METNGKSMLRVQIGPVQDFIAAARTTRDLWSGSYLLSRLMAAALHYLEQQEGAEIIFPCTKELSICQWWVNDDAESRWVEGAETPCLSNKLVACVPTQQADAIATAVKKAVQDTWQGIAARVWSMLPPGIQGDTVRRARYDMQVSQHLAVDYAHLPMDMTLSEMQQTAQGVAPGTPLTESLQQLASGDTTAHYACIYYLVDHCMNAVRKVNGFRAWNAGLGRDAGWYAARDLVKDYLTGKEEQVFCMSRDKQHCQGWPYAPYLNPCKDDVLGAITLIKRLWYVDKMKGHDDKLPELNAPYGPNVEDIPDAQNHYYAVLAMDGDNIGAALTHRSEGGCVDADFHRLFSATLAEFAQKKAGAIVQAYQGKLIYAGGDDVLALLPLFVRKENGAIATAVDCAAELGAAFRDSMSAIRRGMTVSAGLSLVHSKDPLQDAVAAARQAEARAKSTLGRGAFSISVMKRSGEIVEWGAKWESCAQELLNTWIDNIEHKAISPKGAHRYAELLTPYMSRQSNLVNYQQHEPYGEAAARIALLEFESMMERQWVDNRQDKAPLRNSLYTYVENLMKERIGTEETLRVSNPADELVPMCSVIAFMGRNPNAK